jgi:hypothetical protein
MSPQRQSQEPQLTPNAQVSPMSPALARRRRIIESDDEHPPQNEHVNPQHMPPPAQDAIIHQPEVIEHTQQDVVVLESSESDDMYVLNPRAQHQPQSPQTRLPREQTAATAASRTRRRSGGGCSGSQRTRRRFVAAAAESDNQDDDDVSSECIESDTNAQMQYREAIMGVRNARMGRAQLRAATTHCPVCALFADFLAHFV